MFDYRAVSAVDTMVEVAIYLAVAELVGGLPMSNTLLNTFGRVAIVGWVLAEAAGLVSNPLAFMTSWTPYEQSTHMRHLALLVAVLAPLLFRRTGSHHDDRDVLLEMVRSTASTIERNTVLLNARRQAARP